jgi:alkanesulfonate monooxygenase SsuD/methylene tetrahydromethanopterin reductase-like flavin-dependent oxidoreductase (luciferase family)
MLLESDTIVCGDPDYVAARLHELQQVYGFTEVLCWTRLGGLDNRKVLRSMELMEQRVIPHLRECQPPPPPDLG